jgi:molybdopterin molybdotransferase
MSDGRGHDDGPLVPVDEQLALVLKTVSPLAPLRLGLAETHGSQLAEDVIAPISLPPFDNSSMDGYAVRLDDVAGATASRPVSLPVVADIAAGSQQELTLQPGLCARIMTGAPTPPGTEAIVPLEWTDGGDKQVQIRDVPRAGAYIRRIGEDLHAGATVLTTGTYLGAAQIGVLAAIGRVEVAVHPRPRVVIISTGSELAKPGDALERGQIYESNSYALAAACREAGAQPYRVGVVRDDPDELVATLEDYLIQADMIITSGGVSVGAYDVVKQALARMGSMSFRRVAMQPGMPQGFGTIGLDSVPLFALPGNPVSALVSFEVFVRPAIRRLMGSRELYRPIIHVVLTEPWRSPAGKRQYVRVQLEHHELVGYQATPIGGPGSHLLSAMSNAHALLVVPEHVTDLPAGARASAILLDRRHS